MKTTNKFANVHFISSMVALKARNNRISNENLSETAQNHPRSSVIAVPGYMRKKELKTVSTHQFASLRKSSFNMTRGEGGGMKILNLEA